MDPIDALAVLRLVPELFQITKALEAAAPVRHFTLDGHLRPDLRRILISAQATGSASSPSSASSVKPLWRCAAASADEISAQAGTAVHNL